MFEIIVCELIPIFVRLQCWVLPALVFEGYVWYFGSLHLAFEMSCDIEYLEKQLLFFLETWSSSFCIVCIWFDDFRTNRPKNIGRFHRKENTNFPKRRWVRSKIVFLSSALLFSLVVKKMFWEIHEISLLGTIPVFLFKCRVTFRLRQFSNARFGNLALYILRLRCLGLSNTYKNSFCFLSKTENFQNDVEYVPKMSFWALLSSARLDSLVVNKKSCFENLLGSIYMEQYVFFVQMQRQLLAAIFFERYFWHFGSLHPAFEMSRGTEYL